MLLLYLFKFYSKIYVFFILRYFFNIKISKIFRRRFISIDFFIKLSIYRINFNSHSFYIRETCY